MVMPKAIGIKAYKHYWQEQAEFMDKDPWSKNKVVELRLSIEKKALFKDLQISNHSISKEGKEIIIKIKAPYNYYEIDDFETKVIELLGIEKSCLIDISIDVSNCTSSNW